MIRYWHDFCDAYIYPLLRSLQATGKVEIALVVFYTVSPYRSERRTAYMRQMAVPSTPFSALTNAQRCAQSVTHFLLRSSCCLTRTDWSSNLAELRSLLSLVDLSGGDLCDACLSGSSSTCHLEPCISCFQKCTVCSSSSSFFV